MDSEDRRGLASADASDASIRGAPSRREFHAHRCSRLATFAARERATTPGFRGSCFSCGSLTSSADLVNAVAMARRLSFALLCLAVAAQVCVDDNPNCALWAKEGECHNNPSFMHSSCARTCGTCPQPDDPSTIASDTVSTDAPSIATPDTEAPSVAALDSDAPSTAAPDADAPSVAALALLHKSAASLSACVQRAVPAMAAIDSLSLALGLVCFACGFASSLFRPSPKPARRPIEAKQHEEVSGPRARPQPRAPRAAALRLPPPPRARDAPPGSLVVADLLVTHRAAVDALREAVRDNPLFRPAQHDELFLLRFVLSFPKPAAAAKACANCLRLRAERRLDEAAEELLSRPFRNWGGGQARPYAHYIPIQTVQPDALGPAAMYMDVVDADMHAVMREVPRDEFRVAQGHLLEFLFQVGARLVSGWHADECGGAGAPARVPLPGGLPSHSFTDCMLMRRSSPSSRWALITLMT